MQNYADYADELVEQIDAGELDPDEVDMRPFVEDEETVLTPALAKRLPDDKVEEYNARVRKRDELELRDYHQERQEQADKAKEILRGADPGTTTAELPGGHEIEVRGYIGDAEKDAFSDRSRAFDEDEISQEEYLNHIYGFLSYLCVEGGFDKPRFWEEYRREYGKDTLMVAANAIQAAVTNKIDERMDVVTSFRDDE